MRVIPICLFWFLAGVIESAVVPFKDSVEIVFTPEDIRKGTDYVLWKVPTVKNNFKTTVKQKLLNRLLSKDLQELRLNSPPPGGALVSANEVQSESTVMESKAQGNLPLQNIQLEVQKPKGLVNSVLKGPSASEKPVGRIRYFDEKKEDEEAKIAQIGNVEKEKVVKQAQKDLGEHVGYLKPSNVKNRKHNFDIGRKRPSEGEESETDIEIEVSM